MQPNARDERCAGLGLELHYRPECAAGRTNLVMVTSVPGERLATSTWSISFEQAKPPPLDPDPRLQYNPRMTTEKLTFELAEGANPHVYRLTGPMVLGNMEEIQEALRAETVSTVLDLTGVPYMDSAGLAVLTNSFVSHQKNGRKFLVAGANDRIRTLFQITKLDQLFTIFPTVEAARQAAS